jgi:predicted amidohydrolase YtcJ
VSPLEGIWVAVNRITRQRSVLGSDQRVDVVSALRAYTSDAAYFSFEEHLKGTLEPGKFADLAVLSADPTQTPDERLNTLRVEATIIAGNVAWTEADTRGPSA